MQVSAGGSCTAQQQTLRRLSTVFASFFNRVKAGAKAGYPRFKPYTRFDQVMFVAGDGSKWEQRGGGKWAHATFRAVGTVKVQQHRPVRGTVKTLTLKREGRRWYVIVTADTAPGPLPATGRPVGIDVGVARFLSTSDGEVTGNPRFLGESAGVIADLQRRKERAKPGSGNRKRLRRALAKEWRKTRNRRLDFHHKTARRLVSECDVIALEDLNTAGITRRPAPKPDPGHPGAYLPNGSAAKAGLSTGRRVILVNPAYTSITCHQCGARCERPKQSTVLCPACGPHDADVNGARNIYARAGLGSGQTATAA
jgi:putative transposase